MSQRILGIDSNSLTFRGLTVAVLALLMLIPVGMVRGVIDERHESYQGVVQQVRVGEHVRMAARLADAGRRVRRNGRGGADVGDRGRVPP